MPKPILLLTGEQGTAKSWAARICAGTLYPSSAELRTAPRALEDWAVAASGSYIVPLDNVSFISAWLSDALCRAVTGDGLVRRQLYTDDDLSVLSFQRAVILTAIDPGSLRGDLADRLLPLELERIGETQRRTDRAIRSLFEARHPYILDGVLDMVVEVLRVLPGVDLDRLPRMADFARVLKALDQVRDAQSLETYLSSGDRVVADVIESDPVAGALLRYVQEHGELQGTAADIATRIAPDPEPREWPRLLARWVVGFDAQQHHYARWASR